MNICLSIYGLILLTEPNLHNQQQSKIGCKPGNVMLELPAYFASFHVNLSALQTCCLQDLFNSVPRKMQQNYWLQKSWMIQDFITPCQSAKI